MPHYAETLTKATNGRIDFFNIGGLLQQRTKNSLWGIWTYYSWRELIIRGSLLAATAACITMDAVYNSDPNRTVTTKVVRGVAVGLGSFIGFHAIAAAPTLWRRHKIITETEAMRQGVLTTLRELKSVVTDEAKLQAFIDHIDKVTQQIVDFDLPVSKRGQAVMNLVRKKACVSDVVTRCISLSIKIHHNPQNAVSYLVSQKDYCSTEILNNLIQWSQSSKTLQP
jgi:hypothetical protein